MKSLNTDSVHIVCSTNCVYCTITNDTESSDNQDTIQASYDKDTTTSQNESFSSTKDTTTPHNDESFCGTEPYTSEKLSRLRSGYKLLSSPSSVVKFNFNNRQVCHIFSLLFGLFRM